MKERKVRAHTRKYEKLFACSLEQHLWDTGNILYFVLLATLWSEFPSQKLNTSNTSSTLEEPHKQKKTHFPPCHQWFNYRCFYTWISTHTHEGLRVSAQIHVMLAYDRSTQDDIKSKGRGKASCGLEFILISNVNDFTSVLQKGIQHKHTKAKVSVQTHVSLWQ